MAIIYKRQMHLSGVNLNSEEIENILSKEIVKT